jgi:hypothetical protein
MADDFEKGGSPLYARLARAHAEDPLVAEISGDHRPQWELPLRLFGGVHYLVLSGRVPDGWEHFGDTLRVHRGWLTRFVREQPVQTNEVQRSWALVPGVLAVADGRPVDLIELGPSAGLNLLWDHYRYRYGGLAWGNPAAELELVGNAVDGPPAELLDRGVEVRARLGVDRHPVDVRSEEGALLLESFVWADQAHRLDRLRRAIQIVRADTPQLVQGDYVETLPRLLRERDTSVLTVIYHSVSLGYLSRADRERVRALIAEDGERGSLAHVSLEFVEDPAFDGFALDVTTFPDGQTRRLARVTGHADELVWVAG